MNNLVCAFTGHRPQKFPWKYDEMDKRCIALKAILVEQIKLLINVGVRQFLSGMALGTDTWAAEIVLIMRKENPALKLRLHCILPYERQADKWSDAARERYNSILKHADSIRYVSRDYYDGCLLDRNRRLVDSADFLIAVFNGVRRSGTGATVSYARKLGREIIVINPITQFVTYDAADEKITHAQ